MRGGRARCSALSDLFNRVSANQRFNKRGIFTVDLIVEALFEHLQRVAEACVFKSGLIARKERLYVPQLSAF